MTVRFKCQSEYQKSYGSSRSRSVSPQRCSPSAGLRSDMMGVGREPGLQRRKRTGPVARSCSALLFPQDDPDVGGHTRSHPAASRSRSVHRKEPSLNQKPATPTGPPAGPRPAADPEPPERPDPESAVWPEADGKSVKLRPSEPVSQSQPSSAVTRADPDEHQKLSDIKVDQATRWRAGLRSGGQRSEYHRQFSWKEPVPAASPLLTAEQVLNSSIGVIPLHATNTVPMETEYWRSFRGLAPPTGPRLRKHLEHERVPLFHTQLIHKEKRAEPHKPHPKQELSRNEIEKLQSLKDTPPPPQVQKRRRMLTEYQSRFHSRLYRNSEGGGATDAIMQQVTELRQQARWYRRRAWGTNFCREHLNQLLSEHNALWEPDDTTDTSTHRRTPDLTSEPDGRSTSCVEALDLPSNSSRTSSSAGGSGGPLHSRRRTDPGSAERPTAWGEEEEKEEEEEEEKEEEETLPDEEEGRLPTPRLKRRPVQRTHHDLTTPATGCAILVGRLQSTDCSSEKQQKCGWGVSKTTGAEPVINMLSKHKEAWPESNPSPAPEHKPISSPTSKPVSTKHASPTAEAPPPVTSSPQHGIQGTMRHPDFQHNGDLGQRFWVPPCSRGGSASDEDDRLSVMSWRSAASCSAASAILVRAQKRREDFWGKR